MQTYSWPGNVRQLENCLKRAYLLSESSQITPVDLPDEIFDSTIPPTDLQIEMSDQGVSLEQVIGEYIQAALRQANGVQTKAASLLGMSRRRLQSRMNHYGFNSKDYKN